MTQYKLPDQLGGGEVDAVEYDKDGQTWIWFPIGEWMMHCRSDALTKVEPPLPPEPPIGTVMLDKDGDVWQRDNETSDYGWVGTAVPARVPWECLNAKYGPLTRLVPDPADDAPALPWECDDEDGDELRIEPTSRTDLAAFIKTTRAGVRLTAADARLAAAALLRAAREVEQ